MEREKEDKEQSFIVENKETGEKKIYVDILLKTLLQRYMGEALDLARVSPMPERQFIQYTRKMKDYCYRIAKDGAKILGEFGYELGDKQQ